MWSKVTFYVAWTGSFVAFDAADSLLLGIMLLSTLHFGLKILQVLMTNQLFTLQETLMTNFSLIQFLHFVLLPHIRKGLNQVPVCTQLCWGWALLQPVCLVSTFLNFVQNFFWVQQSDWMRSCLEATELSETLTGSGNPFGWKEVETACALEKIVQYSSCSSCVLSVCLWMPLETGCGVRWTLDWCYVPTVISIYSRRFRSV